MNIEKINPWLTLISNLSVVAGIVFLAVEINQNSELLQFQAVSQEQQRFLGRYVDSPELPRIEAKLIGDISASSDSPVAKLVRDYGLTPEDARRWTRYVLDQWLSNASRYNTGASEACRVGARLATPPYNRMIFDALSRNNLSDEYVDCVETFLE